MEIIRLHDFSFGYNKENVLTDIDFTVNKGDFILLCGMSASGKSTLLSCLKGCPEGNFKGDRLVLGKKAGYNEVFPCNIGYITQDPDSQIVCHSVLSELYFSGESIGMDKEKIRLNAAELSVFFGIEGLMGKTTDQLSGGEKQLLNLASVMLTSPDVLILDEPTAQLDPVGRNNLLSLLSRINKELGTAIVIAEHNTRDVISLCKSMAVIDKGKIIALGDVKSCIEKIKNHPLLRSMPAGVRLFDAIGGENFPLDITGAKQLYKAYSENNTLYDIKRENPHFSKENVIELKNVTFTYFGFDKPVINKLSLNIKKGECLFILGGNGSGKTTLLRLIAGLEKPAVGDVYKTGRIALLPQQPLLLFTKDTVKEEFCDNKASSDVIELCNISHLLSRHPTELSGGELQRCAIALLLSMDFDTLLLDEPSKGMDKESVELLGQIIKALKGNKTIICVSHDTDFAAESSDRCAMLFGGDIISLENKEKFFSGNEFFTTDGVIISKGIKDNVVSDNDLIYTVTGKYPEKSDIKIPADNPTENKKAPFPLYRKICLGLGAVTGIISLLMAGGVIPLKFPGGQYSGLLTLIVPVILLIIGLGIKNRKFTPDRGKIPTITQILVGTFTLISVPLTIALGNMLTDERKWLFISILVLIECIMPFFFLFELKRPSPKEIVLLSIMCGIAIAGREIFFFLPQVKPVAALVIISGVAFGWQAGFITGAVTMLVSNLLFGQGVYTPFQMLAMGLVGFFAGVIFRRGCNTAGLLIYGFLSVFLLYGPIMNISQALLYTNSNIKTILAAEIAGIPMDIIHGISTVAFLLLGGVQLLPVLLRAVKKSGAFK